MRYQLKQIQCRPWTLAGLSLPLMESHYENN
jgi:superoxide dismutase, Fe-Mn family